MAALIPYTLFAATEIPIPEPQTKTPRLSSNYKTFLVTFNAKSG